MAPMSVSLVIGALLRMLMVLEPQRDWTVLARVYQHLKRTAAPSCDKLSRMVPATDLFALGIRLMDTWAAGPPQRVNKPSRYRDGLLIALLISCPVRMRNLTSIEVGRHLLWDGQVYQPHFTAAETKTRRPYAASVPRELTPYVDAWLQVHRPVQSIALGGGQVGTGATSGSTAGAGPWAARRSGSRSKRAPGRRSVRRSGRTCSGTAPSPSWSTAPPSRSG